MAWELVPCLVALRDEFNRVSPSRDRSSDGSIGDRAHALSSSDHNPDESASTPYEDADSVDEVHAIDVDDTGPWPESGWFDAAVERIRLRHQRGEDDRLQNIIRRGRIASRSWGWSWRPYGGSNPHDHHAHFSARYTTAQERDTSPWGVEEDIVTPEDRKAIIAGVRAELAPLFGQLLLAVQQTAQSVLTGRRGTAEASAADAERDAALRALIQQISAQIEQVDDQVLAQLRSTSAAETADRLRAALGDQAAEVGRLLAGAAPQTSA